MVKSSLLSYSLSIIELFVVAWENDTVGTRLLVGVFLCLYLKLSNSSSLELFTVAFEGTDGDTFLFRVEVLSLAELVVGSV